MYTRVLPIVFEQRPEHLIEIFSATTRGGAEALLDGAQLAQRRRSPAFLQVPHFDAARTDRSKHELPDESAASRKTPFLDGGVTTLAFRGFKGLPRCRLTRPTVRSRSERRRMLRTDRRRVGALAR